MDKVRYQLYSYSIHINANCNSVSNQLSLHHVSNVMRQPPQNHHVARIPWGYQHNPWVLEIHFPIKSNKFFLNAYLEYKPAVIHCSQPPLAQGQMFIECGVWRMLTENGDKLVPF